mmetsp:Transcript_71989/g.186960  ORF Transcript_71989/g.186960 Transcript_71989/m.186960 type:complete len:213 (-) Transcript_71989:317-955(-)
MASQMKHDLTVSLRQAVCAAAKAKADCLRHEAVVADLSKTLPPVPKGVTFQDETAAEDDLELMQLAIRNYCHFHNLPSATLDQVAASSAGVLAWSEARLVGMHAVADSTSDERRECIAAAGNVPASSSSSTHPIPGASTDRAAASSSSDVASASGASVADYAERDVAATNHLSNSMPHAVPVCAVCHARQLGRRVPHRPHAVGCAAKRRRLR